MNQFYQQYLNPIKLHPLEPEQLPQYLSKHMDDYPFYQTIKPWQTKRNYGQPWQTNDEIRLQYQSNYAPIVRKLIDIDGRVWLQGNMVQIRENEMDPGMFIYEISTSLAG